MPPAEAAAEGEAAAGGRAAAERVPGGAVVQPGMEPCRAAGP